MIDIEVENINAKRFAQLRPTKLATKILPAFSGWTASPSPRDGAGNANRWALGQEKNKVHLNKLFSFILALSFFTLGCNSTSATNTPDELLDDVDFPTPTLQIGTPQPLCAINSSYQIGLSDLNKPISECNLYFHVVFPIADPDERYFQVIIQPDKPFTFDENGFVDFTNLNQIIPYWYRWVIKNQQGQVERAWLAYFIRGRDGLYHTIVSQPEQDWQNSYLEIFFEDVNKDGVREDVTYEIIVGEFLSKVTNP